MKNLMKTRLATSMGVLALLLSPMAFAHGLAGHHAPLLTVLQHLLTEHGYILALPIGLGMVWYAKREKGLRDVFARLQRNVRTKSRK